MALGLVLSTGNSSWGKSVPSVLQEGRLSGLEEILSRVTLCLKFGESVGDKLGRGHRQGTGEFSAWPRGIFLPGCGYAERVK